MLFKKQNLGTDGPHYDWAIITSAAAAAAKSLQSCLTLWDPMDCSPPGSSVHGISSAKILGCHFLLQGIFLTQGSNTGLLHCRQILHSLSHHGKTDLKPVPLSTIHMIFGKYSIHFIPPSIQSFTCYHKS